MISVNGKYNEAMIYTDNVEETAIGQIIELCNQEFCKDNKIAIMPDCHAGAGCTIGTTMTIQDKVVPNLVGVDIGCGMTVVQLKDKNINLDELDSVIRKCIPSGFNTRDTAHKFNSLVNWKLKCIKKINLDRATKSIGTLGGGNHFIEINKDENGNLYLVVHSGSRYLGKQIAEFYQNVAYEELLDINKIKSKIVQELKAIGKEKEIQSALANIKIPKINKQLAYLQGENFNHYLYDMKVAQHYATLNRKAMIYEIITNMGLTIVDEFTTIHNYIDMDNMILRKGAVSAQKNEKLLIPINMRDGSLICVGKGNPDWNYSAPHGAGRIMSRSMAKELVSLEDYKQSMQGVYTTCIGYGTIDESPMAYKPIKEIMNNIVDTVDICKIIKPIYNFKAGE
jgi:tRNA-splicing ligase RtcB